jgi:dTDP-L-rhamnose 4-epimerase
MKPRIIFIPRSGIISRDLFLDFCCGYLLRLCPKGFLNNAPYFCTKILITGGAGFIGSHTADALSKKGYSIVILDNLEPPVHDRHWPKYVLNKGYTLIRGDVRKKQDLLKALKGVSYVYHLAAYQDQRPDFSKFFETNTVSSAILYELIVEKKLPVKKVILASSQFAYGDGVYRCRHDNKFFFPELRTLEQFKHDKFDILCKHGQPAKFYPFREEQQLTPTNAYGLSKEAIERLAIRFGKTYGIATTLLRYSIVQGPRQSPLNLYSGALRIFVTQALAGKPISVYEDGHQTRDFVNIGDVVAANTLALKNKKTDFEIFNVGGGKAWKVLDFAKLVKKITNSTSPIAVGGFRRTDTRHAVSDISKLRKLGWKPRFAPEKSVSDYIEWYRANFKV